jgi:hypothetical protein
MDREAAEVKQKIRGYPNAPNFSAMLLINYGVCSS